MVVQGPLPSTDEVFRCEMDSETSCCVVPAELGNGPYRRTITPPSGSNYAERVDTNINSVCGTVTLSPDADHICCYCSRPIPKTLYLDCDACTVELTWNAGINKWTGCCIGTLLGYNCPKRTPTYGYPCKAPGELDPPRVCGQGVPSNGCDGPGDGSTQYIETPIYFELSCPPPGGSTLVRQKCRGWGDVHPSSFWVDGWTVSASLITCIVSGAPFGEAWICPVADDCPCPGGNYETTAVLWAGSGAVTRECADPLALEFTFESDKFQWPLLGGRCAAHATWQCGSPPITFATISEAA